MPVTKPISSIFKTDPTLETKGIWVDYGESGRFLIARSGGRNRAFRNLMEQRIKPFRAAMNAGASSDEAVERTTRKVFSETVVLDWEQVDELGESIPFTPDACYKLFEELPDLFLDIMQQSQMIVNFVEETREADAKGSGDSSTGE